MGGRWRRKPARCGVSAGIGQGAGGGKTTQCGSCGGARRTLLVEHLIALVEHKVLQVLKLERLGPHQVLCDSDLRSSCNRTAIRSELDMGPRHCGWTCARGFVGAED